MSTTPKGKERLFLSRAARKKKNKGIRYFSQIRDIFRRYGERRDVPFI